MPHNSKQIINVHKDHMELYSEKQCWIINAYEIILYVAKRAFGFYNFIYIMHGFWVYSNNDIYFCQRQTQIVLDTSSEKRTNGFCQRQMNIVVEVTVPLGLKSKIWLVDLRTF